ncbi:hypothetical protein Q8A67_019429 [Cirrhinus molitorella]|uniref:Uncharacterized protein n=1 Tax=Cirrhinus molitorella TaxID=172907 RepID=A0AA88TPQ8_9TELE|nr:hypothetical protein Q8A67_019429 [Cirrhinus molitorella]
MAKPKTLKGVCYLREKLKDSVLRVHLIPSQEREQCQMAEYSSRDSGQVVDRHPPSEYTDILADCQQTACGM